MNTKCNYNYGRNHRDADVLQENINHNSKQVNLLAAEADIIHNSKRSFNQLPVFNGSLNPGQVSFGILFKIIFLLYTSQVLLASAVAQRLDSIIPNNSSVDGINRPIEIKESRHVNYTSDLFYPEESFFNKTFNNKIDIGTDKLDLMISLFNNNTVPPFKCSAADSDTIADCNITRLENEIKELKENAELIKLSPVTTSDDKIRLSAIENTTQKLQTNLDDLKKDISLIISKLAEFMENTPNITNSFRIELDIMTQEVAQCKNQLRDDCIKDIESQKFQLVMTKLLKLDNSEIKSIIKKVYNNQERNFDLLLNFANNVTHVPQNFFIYSALHSELSSNEHINDSFRFISLAKGLKTQVIEKPWYSKSENSEYKTQSEEMMNDIMNKIRILSKKLITQAMLPGNAHSSDALVGKISETFNYDLLKELATDLVNDFFNTIDTQELISRIDDHYKSYWLTIFCFTTIYNRMPRDDPAIFELTRRVKKLLNSTKHSYLNSNPIMSSCKSEYEKLRNRIPEAVRNLVYADSVCVKNVYYDEYLFASNYSYAESTEYNRLVFTRKKLNTTNQNLNQYKWIFENEENNIFHIKNVCYYPEYMNASSYSAPANTMKRHVFDSMPGNNVASKWRIIPAGDDFYFVNKDKNEYLFADSIEFWDSTKESRYVFTNIEGNVPYDSKWKIEKNC